MLITIRYTEEHDKKEAGLVRAIIPELPISVAYGTDRADAQRKILDQALIALALSIRANSKEPRDVFPLEFQEEESPEGY